MSPNFKWEPKIDEEQHLESELLWPIDGYKQIEDSSSGRRLLTKLKKGNYRKEIIDSPNGEKETIYFQPKGKVWVGDKLKANAQ